VVAYGAVRFVTLRDPETAYDHLFRCKVHLILGCMALYCILYVYFICLFILPRIIHTHTKFCLLASSRLSVTKYELKRYLDNSPKNKVILSFRKGFWF